MTAKRQHLVWRKYLAPWTDTPNTTDGSLYCWDIVKNEIRFDSIENLGVQNYAYDISTLNESDKKIVIQYYKKWLDCGLKGINYSVKINDSSDIFKKDFIENNFISPIENQGQPMLEGLYNHEFPFDGPTKLELVTKELKSCMTNSLLGIIEEEKCNNLLKQSEKLRKNPPRDLRFDFYEYLSVQMLRTWKSKNTILNAIQDTIQHFPETDFKDATKAIFPLMMIVNSKIIANALCNNDFYIKLIDNKTEREFLTCDLPVINLKACYKENKSVNELVIFYPLTPYLAIICTNMIKSNMKTTITSVESVDEYNNKIISAAEKQIYSKTKEELELYLKK